MTDNQIDTSSVDSTKIAKYSSDAIKKSLSLAKKLSNEKPNLDAKYYYDLGVKSHDDGDYEKAIDYFGMSIDVDSKYMESYFGRAWARYVFCIKAGKYFQIIIIKDLDRYIVFNPKNSQALKIRASVKGEIGDYHGAIEDCDRVINIDPKNSEALMIRASVKYQIGDYHGAIEDCDRVISLDSENPEALKIRGTAKCQIGDSHGAIEDLNRLIIIDPENSSFRQALNLRACMKEKIGDYHSAIEDYDRLISIDPKYPLALMSRDSLKHKIGNFME